jgi:hypothetical protein
MAHGPKYELEQRTPMDMFNWILKIAKRSKYKFVNNFHGVLVNRYTMDRSNGRQIFEYILSQTTEERAQTYFNVFVRLKHCTIPQPENLFFVYYAVQTLVQNLQTVNDDMRDFLNDTKSSRTSVESSKRIVGVPMADETYTKAYIDCIEYLERVYRPKIKAMSGKTIEYEIRGSFSKLEVAPYTQETFLEPSQIYTLIESLRPSMVDLSTYQEIITSILLNAGSYRLDIKAREQYMSNFSKLLNTNPLNMQNNTANLVTVEWLARRLYYLDEKELKSKLPGKGDCSSAKLYLKEYTSIVKLLE